MRTMNAPQINQSRTGRALFRQVMVILATLVLAGFSGACNFPLQETPSPAPADSSATAAPSTLEAQLTQVAGTLMQPSPTAISTTKATLEPTASPEPTATQTPLPTEPPLPCNWASFKKDVTIPDGRYFSAGDGFEKTWRLENSGACTWTEDYALIFVDGDRMGGENTVAFDQAVLPGESIDLSVDLTAPDSPGRYRGYWGLQDEDGSFFGIGGDAEGVFWVDIRVRNPRQLAYSFAEEACDAAWSSDAGTLPCPGSPSDSVGSITLLDQPMLEGGRKEDEPGLLMIPEHTDGGMIQGTYPSLEIKDGDQFRSLIACQANSPDCNLRMRLDYRVGSGDLQILAVWDEKSEGFFQQVAVDLSDLSGKKVKFVLTVLARAEFNDDNALWVQPSIWRECDREVE